MNKYLTILVALIFIVISCKDDDATPKVNQPQEICDSLAPTYDSHIKAIIQTNCATATCHGNAGADGKFMRTYAETKSVANTGEFIKAIRHESGAVPMPQGGDKLSDENIQLIECWIQNDFPEN